MDDASDAVIEAPHPELPTFDGATGADGSAERDPVANADANAQAETDEAWSSWWTKWRDWWRLLATVPILIGLAFALWYPLPNSRIKAMAPSWWVPATELFGLQQNWAMFSPDPPELTLDVEAVVTDDEGKEWVINVPRPNPVVGPVYSERFRKWEERIYPVGMNPEWPNAARWFATKARAEGIAPKQIELRRSWTMTDLPGRPHDPKTYTFVFFTYEVDTGTSTFHDPELNPNAVQPGQAAPAASTPAASTPAAQGPDPLPLGPDVNPTSTSRQPDNTTATEAQP